MGRIVDSHTHVFPDTFGRISSALANSETLYKQIQELRTKGRYLLKPVSQSLHTIQPFFRHIPNPLRTVLDQIGGLASLPHLLLEGTLTDLEAALKESQIDQAMLIAHPPHASNDFVIELTRQNPSLHAVVNIPGGSRRPSYALESYIERGAKALMIHPAADGEELRSSRYRSLLKTAGRLKIPVILHTGKVFTSLFHKDPSKSDANLFKGWFQNFDTIKFLLAHMNFHKPGVALDLAEEFPNISVGTSWQPSELISEATRRIGAERVLFASDWPLIGQNMSVMLKRVGECVEGGRLTQTEADLILGENAVNFFNLREKK